MTTQQASRVAKTKPETHPNGAPLDDPKVVYTELTSTWEWIDEELAYKYLETYSSNRKIVQAQINRHTADMESDNWRTTHQGIGFDWYGRQIDGQHRLWALIAAKVRLKFLVTRGMDPKANDGIDSGRSRSVADILHYQGENVGWLESSLAKWIAQAKNPNPTRIEIGETFIAHKEAITTVIGWFHTRPPRITQSSVVAPIVRAYYQEKHRDQLPRFIEVLIDGKVKGEDEHVILLLRDYLLRLKTTGGYVTSKQVYNKSGRALYAYLRGEQIAYLKEATKEMFPLPN